MCGIAGIHHPAGVDPAALREAAALLAHRGPDAEGLWTGDSGRLAMAHRRLKILDLSDAANQPMRSPDGRWTIVFNGEIVNYRAMDRRTTPGWPRRTSGDTELLLDLLAHRGLEALHDCVGMFALAIHDARERTLTLARDRFGIKPLYLCGLPGSGLAFASEIPPLLRLRGRARPDLDVVRTFLETAVYDAGPRTFFEGIESLAPGTACVISLADGSRTDRRWYDLSSRVADLSGMPEPEIEREAARLVRQAVTDHLVADVPVGLNVSGGVDSSVLVGAAREHLPGLHLFTQDYPPPYSELAWVRQVSGDAPLHVCTIGPEDALTAVEDTAAIQAEPFGGVFVAGYGFLYREARRSGVTVLLDGNGVDEIFLGYQRHHLEAVRLAPESRRVAMAADYAAFWGEPPRFEPTAGAAAIDGSAACCPEAVDPGLRASAGTIEAPLPGHWPDPLRREAAADLLARKIPRGLRFNDRMSMACGRELRVPFLDHRLVEFGFGVPASMLLDRTGSKALFRRLATRWIPSEVAFARKRSVQSPQREWLAGPWRPLVEETLGSRSFAQRGWIDPVAARAAWEAWLAGDRRNSFHVWQWINLEWWARRYLDRLP